MPSSCPSDPGTAPLLVDRDGLALAMVDDDAGTRLTADWVEADGRPGHLDVLVELPAGHESLNVVIPWSDTVFNFTSKHHAAPGGRAPDDRGACVVDRRDRR